jgi:hypothetical protein
MGLSPYPFLLVALTAQVMVAFVQGQDVTEMLWPTDSFIELPELELRVVDGGFFDQVAAALYNLALIVAFPFRWIIALFINTFVWLFSILALIWRLSSLGGMQAPSIIRTIYFMFMSMTTLWWLLHYLRSFRG